MLGLTSLEFYISIFNINTTNHKFKICTATFEVFSSEKLKHELEEILDVPDITPYHLQHGKKGTAYY